jgi:uncharacterized protein (TIGR03067 family)
MKNPLGVLLLIGLLLGAAEPPKVVVGKELEKLQGDWIVLCVKRDGRFKDMGFWHEETIIRISGDRVKIIPPNPDGQAGAQNPGATIIIDPLKTPATFDLLSKDQAPAPGTLGIYNTLGIYKLDGACLKVNYESGEKARPADFSWMAILARDSKEERAAGRLLPADYEGFWMSAGRPLSEADCAVQCKKILKMYPKTATANIAQDFLDYGFVTERNLEASKLLDFEKNRLKELAIRSYQEIPRKYPGTSAAHQAQDLLDRLLENRELPARQELEEANKLSEDGRRLGRKDLKEKARGRCRQIIESYPETKAAKEAKELLERLSPKQEELDAAKLLEIAKKGRGEKAMDGYLEVLKKYPETKAAREARRLMDELDNGELAARRKLTAAKLYIEDMTKPGLPDQRKEFFRGKAVASLREIIELYPKTRSAAEAEKSLERLTNWK